MLCVIDGRMYVRWCAGPAAVSHAADHYQAPAEAMWYQQPQGYWVQPAGPACQQQQLVAWPWLQPSTWHYAPVPPPPPFWSPYSWPAPPPPPSSWYYCGHAAAAAASAAAPPATFWPPPPTCCMDQAAPLDTTCCCQQCYPSPTTHCFHQPAGCMEPQGTLRYCIVCSVTNRFYLSCSILIVKCSCKPNINSVSCLDMMHIYNVAITVVAY